MTTNPKKPYSRTMNGKEQEEEHESYGMVNISRCTGGSSRFFGSHLEHQSHYFSLRIHQAQVSHDLGRNWFRSRDPLIEIHLTASQFAEMITSLNMGSGVPCTIHRVLGDRMEPLPENEETETKKIRTSFKGDLKALVSSLEAGYEQVNTLLEKKNLTLRDKEAIRKVLGTAVREVSQNLPFLLESFHESTEKVVAQAKAEVDAFVSFGLHKLGLETIRNRVSSGEAPMNILSAGDSEKE